MTDMTLLIVDDSPADRLLMSRYAEAVGDVHVRTASSAQEALTSCEEQGVDLVVTDFMMPGMDGMAFVSRLR